MQARVIELCALLRGNRVRVSVGEVTDAVRAALAVGLDDPETLRVGLRAALVKRAGDRPMFDELFALTFLRGGQLARALEGAPLPDQLAALGLSEDEVARILAVLGDHAHHLGMTARAGLGLRGGDVVPILRATAAAPLVDARIVSPLHVGFHAQRLLNALDLAGAEAELQKLLALLAAALGPEQAALLERVVKDNLAALRRAVREHVRLAFERQNRDALDEMRTRRVTERPFTHLSEEELRGLRVEVVRLARKLREQAALRLRRRRRGRLDVRKTLRQAMATGGVPFVLRYRLRRREKPRLVVLCDVSDSVRQVSRFMLALVHAIQELFAHVRSFVFVSDLGEVTRLFAGHDVDAAIERVFAGAVVNVHANSNYGHAFEVFAARHLDAVTTRTTVIVIGDARNNYNPPNVARLAEIRRRARRLLWLNPELPGSWGFGDSVMREYEPHADRVIVAQHLESLRKVVGELVL